MAHAAGMRSQKCCKMLCNSTRPRHASGKVRTFLLALAVIGRPSGAGKSSARAGASREEVEQGRAEQGS